MIQIPREENEEADRLAKIASSTEGMCIGDIVLCNAYAKWVKAEVYAIEVVEDWRAPIIKAMKEASDTPNYISYGCR